MSFMCCVSVCRLIRGREESEQQVREICLNTSRKYREYIRNGSFWKSGIEFFLFVLVTIIKNRKKIRFIFTVNTCC